MSKMDRQKPAVVIVLLLVFLFGIQAACSLPAFAPTTAATSVPATRISPSPDLPRPSPIPATATITPTPTPTIISIPSQTPTIPSPTPRALYKGFIAYDRQLKTITGYDLAGNPLDIKIQLNNVAWIGENEGQWVNDSFYYVKQDEKAIVQITRNGTEHKLSFIPANEALTFVISPDGKRIAWSEDDYTGTSPSSELWMANIGGTNAKSITRIEAANNPNWQVLRPYRWLPDGRLLYVDSPTGIGGYILFNGFAGIHIFDPSNNKLTNLTPGIGAGGLCLSEISPDLKFVTSACAVGQPGTLSYIELATNSIVSISRQAEQNQVGSPLWSPSGEYMAFAYARGDGSDELGTVAVVTNGGTSPKILGSVSKGYYNVKAWISQDFFLAQRFESEFNSIWVFNREGGNPQKLADGVFISLIQN
jgi:Tol biopolymer transport system component